MNQMELFTKKNAYENGARALLSLLNYDCNVDQGKPPSLKKVSLCPYWVLQRCVENPEAYKFGVFVLPTGDGCQWICYGKFLKTVPHGQEGTLLTITAKKFTGKAEVRFGSDISVADLTPGTTGSIVFDAAEKGNNSANNSLPHAFLFSGILQKLPTPGDVTKQAFAYTDGSFKKDHKGKLFGGYGVTLTFQGKEYTENGPCETESNNIDGEVIAIIAATKMAISLGAKALTIFHDYEHLGNWAVYMPSTEKLGPKKIGAKPERPIAKKLYEEMGELSRSLKLTFIKIQGHAGIEGNRRADELADAFSQKE